MQTIQPKLRNKSKFLHNCGSGQRETQGFQGEGTGSQGGGNQESSGCNEDRKK